MRKKLIENWRIYLIIFLALLAIAVWSAYFKQPDNNLHIYVLDVGQGDAILLQKQNYQVLIDGGPDSSVVEKLAEKMPMEDREIELMILTHPHADHVAGLVDILKRYKVGKVEYSGVKYESNIYKEFSDEIVKQNIEIEIPNIGFSELVFDQGKITFLWPGESAESFKDNLNNTSEVFRFDYGNISAIFPGDCELECWQEVEKKPSEISSIDILKVSHHGSRNGTNEKMLTLIKPKIALISLGKNNKYGFPHKESMDILQKIGASIYRTDLLGTINLSSDSKNWKVE